MQVGGGDGFAGRGALPHPTGSAGKPADPIGLGRFVSSEARGGSGSHGGRVRSSMEARSAPRFFTAQGEGVRGGRSVPVWGGSCHSQALNVRLCDSVMLPLPGNPGPRPQAPAFPLGTGPAGGPRSLQPGHGDECSCDGPGPPGDPGMELMFPPRPEPGPRQGCRSGAQRRRWGLLWMLSPR